MHLLLLALLAAVDLPKCAHFTGDYILAGDVAAVFPPFLQLAPDTRVARAPNPGAFRTLSARDLRAASGSHPGLPIPDDFQACFEWTMQEFQPAQALALMRQALDRPDARVEILDYSPKSLPPGRLIFLRAGLMPLPLSSKEAISTWRGYVEYGPSRREPVWTKVRVRVPVERIVATTLLKAGEEILAGQVRLEQAEEFPVVDITRVRKLDDVIGQSLRRSLLPGLPIQRGMLAAPKIVVKGDTVELKVISGGTSLKLPTRAETSGSQGEHVLFRNPTTGKLIRARIEARGQAVLDLSKGVH